VSPAAFGRVSLAAFGRVSLAALGSLSLAACGVGVSHTLAAASAGHQISTHLATQYGIPAPAVACPSGVRLVPGRTFTCSTLIDGQTLLVHGTLTDASGHFDVTLGQAVLPTTKAASTLASQITAQYKEPASVDCGPRAVLVVAPGGSFTCTGTVGGQPKSVVVTVENSNGKVNYSVLSPTSGSGPNVTTGQTVPGA
jgi:hypothetical protein